MTEKKSLSKLYLDAIAVEAKSVNVEDIAALASSEQLNERQDAAVEALATSPSAKVAYTIAKSLKPDAITLERVLLAKQSRPLSWLGRVVRTDRWVPTAMAAGIIGVSIISGLSWMQRDVPANRAMPEATGVLADTISSMSYESDTAIAEQSKQHKSSAEKIFVDEFGG
jgi:hypothetical protein